MAVFHKAADHILEVEGGFIKHPSDPGGSTKYGITQYALNSYLDRIRDDRFDVRFLHKSTARDIYRELFWEPMLFDQIDVQSVATILFDQCVNQGVHRIPRRAQSVASSLRRDPGPIDGIMGPKTIKAINACPHYRFNREFLIHSQLYYAKIVRDNRILGDFIVGWSRRMSHLWRMMDQV